MHERNDRIDTAGTDRDFAEALTPPGWVYHDEALFQRECDELFARTWLCVGHASRLGKPGDYFVVDIGRDSVIVIADGNGAPRAWRNVCRHRGSRLLASGSGNCRLIRCPYHSWHYAPDGRLVGAPLMDGRPGFDKSHYPLHDVRIDRLQGFLFVNLDSSAAPLAEVYADLPDMSRYGGDALVRVGYHAYDVAANWKLVCENYNECYHCAVAHPQLHRISDEASLSGYNHRGAHFTGGPMRLKSGYTTLTEAGTSARQPMAGIDPAERDLVFYFNLYPNLLYSLAPDYVLTHYLWPTGPESVHIETEWFFSPEQVAEPGFDASDAVTFWDVTNRQDWALCENAQRGLRSSGHTPGPYQAGESCVHDFDRWYVRTMFGPGR